MHFAVAWPLRQERRHPAFKIAAMMSTAAIPKKQPKPARARPSSGA
jgi:hypothetical protein